MEVNANSSNRLKSVRTALGLSQTDMANKLGYNQSYYSEIERGIKGITSKMANNLFALFEVSTDWLINGIGDIPSVISQSNFGVNLAGQEKSSNDKDTENQLLKRKLILEAIGKADLPLRHFDDETKSLYFNIENAFKEIQQNLSKDIDNETIKSISESLNEIIRNKVNYMDFHLIGIIHHTRQYADSQKIKVRDNKLENKVTKFLRSVKGDILNDEKPTYLAMNITEKIEVLKNLEDATRYILDNIWEITREIYGSSISDS